jgi:hypothetical protein
MAAHKLDNLLQADQIPARLHQSTVPDHRAATAIAHTPRQIDADEDGFVEGHDSPQRNVLRVTWSVLNIATFHVFTSSRFTHRAYYALISNRSSVTSSRKASSTMAPLPAVVGTVSVLSSLRVKGLVTMSRWK